MDTDAERCDDQKWLTSVLWRRKVCIRKISFKSVRSGYFDDVTKVTQIRHSTDDQGLHMIMIHSWRYIGIHV